MPVSFEHLAQGTIRLVSKPKEGDVVEIRRHTAITDLAQDYSGAGISRETLKSNAAQTLHKLQELEEGSLTLGSVTIDMKGRRLTNITTPLEATDAVSKGWVEQAMVKGQEALSEHTKQAEASAIRAEESFKKSEALSTNIQTFAKTTEDQTLKLMTEMSEKASLLDKIIQIETQLNDKAQTYEDTLTLRKQEFLETLEEKKDALTLQEQKAQDALETLAHTALEANTSAQENKDLLIAERVKAVAEISELMGRHKVLLETCDSKEKSLQERITQETSSIESKINITTGLVDSKLKETLATLDQKMEQALTTCQTITTGVNDTLKTQLTEKIQETLESMTKARLAGVSEVSELLGRIRSVADDIFKEREEFKSLAKQVKRALRQLTDGEATQAPQAQEPPTPQSQDAQTDSPQP